MSRRMDPVEAAVAMAEAQTGTHKPGQPRIALIGKKPERSKFWTDEEERILADSWGKLPLQQIARKLGRSWSGVVNHAKREMHLTGSTKDPQVLSGEQVALGLSKDGKSIHAMMDKGIMPGHKAPFEARKIRVVGRHAFLVWMLDPMNWCRFNPMSVGQLKVGGKRRISGIYDQEFWDQAAKAIRKARRRWKDEWLTTGQVGRILRCNYRSINKAIRKGTLKATRHQNWRVLRSDLPKKGTFNAKGRWVPRIPTRSENGKANMKKLWGDVRAGRRPCPPIGGKNKKVREQVQFFRLLGKGATPLKASAAVGVSHPTAYKWLKEKHGKGWQTRFAFTRESRKALFFAAFRRKRSVQQAADEAGVHAESCYRWLHQEFGAKWKKMLGPRRRRTA